jgi:Icc-related predicted phosphoesterase
MRIAYISDLHHDINTDWDSFQSRGILTNKYNADVLIIAGDSCELTTPVDKMCLKRKLFIDMELSAYYDTIIEIPGNHDLYNNKYANEYLGDFKMSKDIGISKYYYCNNTIITIGDVNFICSTLWSHITQDKKTYVSSYCNDYRRIPGFNIKRTNAIYDRDKKFIKKALKNLEGQKNIVVTHHVPYKALLDDVARGYIGITVEEAYASDFAGPTEDINAEYWIHGHCHTPINKRLHDCTFVRNPVGYIETYGTLATEKFIDI